MRRVKHYCTIRVGIVDGLSKMRSDVDGMKRDQLRLGWVSWIRRGLDHD
jgi:hypothetical protein